MPTPPNTTPPPADDAPPLVTWDAAAYRRLAAGAQDDAVATRGLALAAADDDVQAGLAPAASPFTLWALLADLAPHAGDATGRAHAALVACVAHTASVDGATATLRLAPDSETLLTEAALGRTPPQHAAWNAYLASLAIDAAAALLVTPGGARRLAGPLAHVQERAAQQIADTEDEIQDAVVAAYDAGASAWDDAADAHARQATVAAGAEALARAVSAGRAARAATLATRGAAQRAQDEDTGSGLFDPAVLTVAAGRVRATFGPGVRLWAALVGDVIAGRVESGGRGWRGALWGAQMAFAAAAGGVAHVVSGSDIVRASAARAGVPEVAATASR